MIDKILRKITGNIVRAIGYGKCQAAMVAKVSVVEPKQLTIPPRTPDVEGVARGCQTCQYKHRDGLDEPCCWCYHDNTFPQWSKESRGSTRSA
jgi:hypothetical protein